MNELNTMQDEGETFATGDVDERDTLEDVLDCGVDDSQPAERLAPSLRELSLTFRLNKAVDDAAALLKEGLPLQAMLQFYSGVHTYNTSSPQEQEREINLFLLSCIYRALAPIADAIPVHCNGKGCVEKARIVLTTLIQKSSDEKFKDIYNHLEQEYQSSECPKYEFNVELSGYQREIKPLKRFDILVNDVDDVMLGIPSWAVTGTEAQSPTFYYDGGDHALLVKNKNTLFVCDCINPGARKAITTSSRILITEIDRNAIKREYFADMILLDKMDWALEILQFYPEA